MLVSACDSRHRAPKTLVVCWVIRVPSVLMGRLWLGFWMGPGHQNEETMVRSLEFSALSPILQRRTRGWKWREEWTTSPMRKPPPRSHRTGSLSSQVGEQSRVPSKAAPQLRGTEAPALGTRRPGRASLPLTALLCALSCPLLTRWTELCELLWQINWPWGGVARPPICSWGNLGTRYLPLASDKGGDFMGLSPLPVGSDTVSR